MWPVVVVSSRPLPRILLFLSEKKHFTSFAASQTPRHVLSIDDLAPALANYGVTVQKPAYFTGAAKPDGCVVDLGGTPLPLSW
jgi:hypothetical protein